MVTISFPGFGIDPFTLNKIAFTIPIFGGIEVRWYGIIITVGILLAALYSYYRSRHEGVSLDDLLDIAIYAIVSAMIGARAYYVLTSLDQYDSFWEMCQIWRGGIAIYGAIIGGAVAVYIVCRVKHLKWQRVFDMVSPGVMIGQILGRWGNFFNGEAFGVTPAETSPLYIFRMGLQHTDWSKMYFYQPTFLYESVWNLIGFLIINAVYKKKKFDGEIFLMYITWYGFGRMLIEGLRTDSLFIGNTLIRISQVVGFLCFVVGLACIITFRTRAMRAKMAQGDYDTVYAKLLRSRQTNTSVTKTDENTGTTIAAAPNDTTVTADTPAAPDNESNGNDDGDDDNKTGENKNDGDSD